MENDNAVTAVDFPLKSSSLNKAEANKPKVDQAPALRGREREGLVATSCPSLWRPFSGEEEEGDLHLAWCVMCFRGWWK